MISLNLPTYNTKIKRRLDGSYDIFDFLRKRYVRLTPEEWVRQHFVHYLVELKGYPSALLQNEISLPLNGSLRRCDTVLFDRDGSRPRMIIEYKAPKVPITEKVFKQISAYNSKLRADYLIVSNGLTHYCFQLNYTDNSIKYLSEVPNYDAL